jgi:hypothetical protein
MQRKLQKMESKQNNWILLYLSAIIAVLVSSCFNPRTSVLVKNGDGVQVENFWSNDFYVTKVTDNGRLVYYKAQKDSIVEIVTYDPLCSRISVMYDFQVEDSLSFSYNSAIRFRQDYESGDLLLETYCNGCHFDRDTTQFWIDRDSINLLNFQNCVAHSGLKQYRFDKIDLLNIFLADSISKLGGY